MATASKSVLRDSILACAVIAAAIVVLWVSRSPKGEPAATANVARAKGPGAGIPRTPVLKRASRPFPKGARRIREARREGPEGPAGAPRPEAAPGADTEDEGARIVDEDRKRQEAVRDELETLTSYSDLLPRGDVESYRFLLGKLAWASELGVDRPQDLEGLFFNSVFFAAGRWGKNPELRRAWVYLFRASGIDLAPAAEQGVVALAEELFDRGLGETLAIETAVFGAPLEGGDARYWKKLGFPPLPDCEVAWDARNDSCGRLYSEFVARLGRILAPEDHERARELLGLFNLSA